MKQTEVTLMDMLNAREARAKRQEQILSKYRVPVISYSLNIAGPIKNSPLLQRCFAEGLARLHREMKYGGYTVKYEECINAAAGCEAILSVEGNAESLKKLCISLENEDTMARLFDMDVINQEGMKLERTIFGFPMRGCIICGTQGSGCASRRVHSVSELQEKTRKIICDYFQKADAEFIAVQAARALLFEVCTSPKPGLVDRFNSGSHRDMDIFTFMTSTAALTPYFHKAVDIGQRYAAAGYEECFALLRHEGQRAEETMYKATGGVNTHKGIIFSLGTLCCAMGRLWEGSGMCCNVHSILKEAAMLVRQQIAADTACAMHSASGKKTYEDCGITGVRGEMKNGLPSVENISLPALYKALKCGKSLEQSGIEALLALMANVTDTNVIARGGKEALAWVNSRAGQIYADSEDIRKFDNEMIERNLSPGGCADLLAITYFLYFCCGDGAQPAAS